MDSPIQEQNLASTSSVKLQECFELLAETVQVLSSSSKLQAADGLAKEYASRIASVRQELMQAIDSLTEEDIQLKNEAAEEAQACSDLRYRARCAEDRVCLSKRLHDEFADFERFVEADQTESKGKKAL
eukprot:symbB.v1.2.037663.t1/scaffold5616.1/size25324/2